MKIPATNTPFRTVLTIVVGLLAIYLYSQYKPLLYVSITLGGLGMLSKPIAQFIDKYWMKLAGVLGLIVPNILLTLIFYLVLTPIAILSRILGNKNQLSLKNNKNSLFKNADRTFTKDSFEKLW